MKLPGRLWNKEVSIDRINNRIKPEIERISLSDTRKDIMSEVLRNNQG